MDRLEILDAFFGDAIVETRVGDEEDVIRAARLFHQVLFPIGDELDVRAQMEGRLHLCQPFGHRYVDGVVWCGVLAVPLQTLVAVAFQPVAPTVKADIVG
ncbi:MAG: hypothetical protein RBT34_07130, partial [Anaerolineaceae bacterium]|nr:hypothetical protein [Anaerolineaceae bacterium]